MDCLRCWRKGTAFCAVDGHHAAGNGWPTSKLERQAQAVGKIVDHPVIARRASARSRIVPHPRIAARRAGHSSSLISQVSCSSSARRISTASFAFPARAAGIAMHRGADLCCGQAGLAGKVVHTHAPFIFAAATRGHAMQQNLALPDAELCSGKVARRAANEALEQLGMARERGEVARKSSIQDRGMRSKAASNFVGIRRCGRLQSCGHAGGSRCFDARHPRALAAHSSNR